jgi:tripartite-type tricarboxylate transporter receptor subunit TctC
MPRIAVPLAFAMLTAIPTPVYPQQGAGPAAQATSTRSGLAASTRSGQVYPSRPIRLVIPYSPGGASDNIARIVMPRLGEALGQTIVIDNRPGGAGSLGRELVVRAAPDGYTLLSTDAPHAINVHLRKLPFDSLKDFTMITTTATGSMIMIVYPGFPAKTVKELIAIARAQPGKLNFGSGGTGAITHMTGELFKLAANVDIVHVPYKSIAPAVTDLIGGQIPIAFPGLATVGGHIRAGRVRLLAVAATKRSPAFPDAPTFEEAGVPGMVAANWYGIMGPARLPRPIVNRLNAELHNAVRMPDVQERFAASGIETLLNSPEEFRAMLVSETARWGTVVKAAGIKPE